MQVEVTKFWRSWSQLASSETCGKVQKEISPYGDVVWLCYQNALRGQLKHGKVVNKESGSSEGM